MVIACFHLKIISASILNLLQLDDTIVEARWMMGKKHMFLIVVANLSLQFIFHGLKV